MIIARIFGGLGNQMFQYAAARTVSLEKKVPLYLDISWYDNMGNATPRKFELDVFPIVEDRVATSDLARLSRPRYHLAQRLFRKCFGWEIRLPRGYCREPHFQYWKGVKDVPSSAYMDGYWQSEKYFEDQRSVIRKDFCFPQELEPSNALYAEQIARSQNAVSVHIRRGDYVDCVSTNAVHGCCNAEYYKKALAYIDTQVTDPHYFFFSDDIKWVQEAFSFPNMTVIVGNEGAKSFRDMQLMSMCKHHIIANSSFSWWGAWLSTYSGIVLSPKYWFADSFVITKDLYLEDWIQI